MRADRTGPAVLPAVVVDAHERARKIVQRAEAVAEARAAEALEQARAQARAELAAQWLELGERRNRELALLEQQLIHLALLAAKRIVGEELSIHPERVADMVAPLLARVRHAQQVTLRVHPDDRAALEASLAAAQARSGVAGRLCVTADPAFERGDCVVISDAGTLDARIDTQLLALARALEAKRVP